jgi:hypothetical protein
MIHSSQQILFIAVGGIRKFPQILRLTPLSLSISIFQIFLVAPVLAIWRLISPRAQYFYYYFCPSETCHRGGFSKTNNTVILLPFHGSVRLERRRETFGLGESEARHQNEGRPL